MTIAEKLKHTSTNEIRLYKEGVFWVAYEQSAFAVCKIKNYHPNKKIIKAVSCEVVSVGFPDNALDMVLSGFINMARQDNVIIVHSKEPINKEAFEDWKNNIPVKIAITEKLYSTSLLADDIIKIKTEK